MMDSVHTNMGAMVALQSLDSTTSALGQTEKEVSTGYRVADAVDDGAAYAVAQGVRSSVAALTTANQQLGNAQGLLSVTLTGLNTASDALISMRSTLTELAQGDVTGDERTSYLTQYHQELSNLKNYFEEANYQGQSLISNFNGQSSGFSSFSLVTDELGQTYHIGTFKASSVYHALCTPTSSTSASTFASFISTGGSMITQMNTLGTWLATVGSQVNFVNNQISYNSSKIDALNAGLGSLVDADLAAESAQLTSLQIRQQLGEQALSIANQAPNTLLSLFR